MLKGRKAVSPGEAWVQLKKKSFKVSLCDLEKVSKAKDKVENNESTKAYVGEATHRKTENNTFKGFCAKQPVEFKGLKSSHYNWTECAEI